MMPEPTVTDTSLRIERLLDAPPERVYRAWTEADQMAKWMVPGEDTPIKVECDARVGGRYRIEMGVPDGPAIAVGTFKELDPPRRIVYTWAWEGDGEDDYSAMGETLITVELKPEDGKTRMVLTHDRFPAREAVEPHVEGWEGCLARLPAVISGTH